MYGVDVVKMRNAEGKMWNDQCVTNVIGHFRRPRDTLIPHNTTLLSMLLVGYDFSNLYQVKTIYTYIYTPIYFTRTVHHGKGTTVTS